MPRGKPTEIIEQRITLGTFERQWIVEQEDYLKNQVAQTKLAIVAVPIGIGLGCGALGYGMYLAGGKIGAGLAQIDFDIPNPLEFIGTAGALLTGDEDKQMAASVKIAAWFGFDLTAKQRAWQHYNEVNDDTGDPK